MESTTPILDKESVDKLTSEFQLLHLLYHRNINQHRSSLWWKHFNILHRKIRQVLLLLIDIDELESTGIVRKLKHQKGSLRTISKKSVKGDQKRKIIATKKSQISALAKYIVKDLLPGCYYKFFSVIELGQFIALGFVLIGLISRFYAILIKVDGTKRVAKQLEERLIKSQNVEEIVGYDDHDGLGEEIGEIVDLKSLEAETIVDGTSTKSEKKRKLEIEPQSTASTVLTTSSKSGKKKKKSVMDDIFGTSSSSDKPEKSKSKKKKTKSKTAMSDIFGF